MTAQAPPVHEQDAAPRRTKLGKVADMQIEPTTEPQADAPTAADDEIRALVTRLSRPHKSGGAVIERAAILAEGARATAVISWIVDKSGVPEHAVDASAGRGLHSPRLSGGGSGPAAGAGTPLRWVLPPGVVG